MISENPISTGFLGLTGYQQDPRKLEPHMCPLPSEIVEGEHFVTADLLNLIPGSSSLAREAESEAAVGSW